MSVFEGVVKTLQDNKRRRLEGGVISIPWSLPRLSTVLPGIEQGRYNLVSATAKAGKTQLADFLYVYQPIEWVINNPDANISVKVFYFSLEVSKESKVKAAIAYKLFKQHKIAISPQKLSSVFADYVLGDRIEEIINSKEFREWFDKFESMVTYHDDLRNPFGIYNAIRSYAEHPDNGFYTYKDILWKNKDGTFTKRNVKDRYIPKRPNEYVIVIVDHIGLLQPEQGETLHQAIMRFSSDFCLEMRDRWNYVPVIVQQQSADSSRAQYTYRGDTIVDKIRPDQEGLADNKYTARDVDLMISLFYPDRYNLHQHEGWNLDRIGDNHREFMINLNRNGISNASIQLYFLGTSSYFSELPQKATEEIYREIEEINKNII